MLATARLCGALDTAAAQTQPSGHYSRDKGAKARLVSCLSERTGPWVGFGAAEATGDADATRPRGLTSNRHAGRPDRKSIRAFAFGQTQIHSPQVVRNDDQPARRVIDEPKRSAFPFLAIGAVAAIVIWSMQQEPFSENNEPKAEPEQASRQPQAGDPKSAGGDLRSLFSADDYPAAAQRSGEEGTVQAQLSVDATGRVSGCTIIRSSGSKTLDGATCSILQRRARFAPARDVNGKAVTDTVTTPPVVWRLEG